MSDTKRELVKVYCNMSVGEATAKAAELVGTLHGKEQGETVGNVVAVFALAICHLSDFDVSNIEALMPGLQHQIDHVMQHQAVFVEALAKYCGIVEAQVAAEAASKLGDSN